MVKHFCCWTRLISSAYWRCAWDLPSRYTIAYWCARTTKTYELMCVGDILSYQTNCADMPDTVRVDSPAVVNSYGVYLHRRERWCTCLDHDLSMYHMVALWWGSLLCFIKDEDLACSVRTANLISQRGRSSSTEVRLKVAMSAVVTPEINNVVDYRSLNVGIAPS